MSEKADKIEVVVNNNQDGSEIPEGVLAEAQERARVAIESVVAQAKNEGRQLVKAASIIVRTTKGSVVKYTDCLFMTEPEMLFIDNEDTGAKGMVPNPMRRFGGIYELTKGDGGGTRVSYYNLDHIVQISLDEAV